MRTTRLLTGAVLLTTAMNASAQRPPAAAITAVQAARIDSVIRFEMQLRGIPGAAVAVVDSGRFVFKRAYGTANLETETPVEVDAVFELASVTKQFTAAAIMLLVEEGKVGLDTPISGYIADTPPEWSGITVRHLLTHTGGLAINALPRYQESALLNIRTPAAWEDVRQQPMRFATGEQGWYSDAGYFLLGLIIEKASGETYRAFMKRRIFDPLRMTSTSILDKARVLKKRVPTYMIRNGELQNWRRDWDHEVPSFFGIFSTLDDLAKWDGALRGNTLLQAGTLQQMWTPAKLNNGQFARVLDRLYGFGFELYDVRGRRTVGHGGASGTYVLRFVDEPLSITVLTNLDATSGGRHHALMARTIAGALRPEYRPANLLAPQADPNPGTTTAVQTLLEAIIANRDAAVMSPAYRTWYATALGFRAFYGGLLRGVTGLKFLATDDISGRTQWGGEPLTRISRTGDQAGRSRSGRVDYWGDFETAPVSLAACVW
ncbi:MAG: serine hydrolase domain-containing protein [Gemmatimonadota bacterium]